MLFAHIYKIDFDGCTFGHIPHTKEKPLIISFGIDIILQQQIELIMLSLIGPKKIATLKVRIKFYNRSTM